MKNWSHFAFFVLLVCSIFLLGGCVETDVKESVLAAQKAQNNLSESGSSKTGNVFLDVEIDYLPITNSTKTKVVGKRASISLTKDDARAATPEDFTEFARDVVDDSGFNWWTVIFDDGTGIVFNGSSILNPEYGKVARDGTVYEAYGALFFGDDDLYSYAKYDN